MSPENQWLEDVFSIEMVPFWGDMLIFRGVIAEPFGFALGITVGHKQTWLFTTARQLASFASALRMCC